MAIISYQGGQYLPGLLPGPTPQANQDPNPGGPVGSQSVNATVADNAVPPQIAPGPGWPGNYIQPE
jgi:hypothetical protein